MTTTDVVPMNVPGIAPTPVGLRIDAGLKYGAWAEYGQRLATVEGGLMWAIGDWMNFGKEHYEDGPANRLAASIGLAERTVWNAASVCRRVPQDVRRPELTYKHHEVVAAQPVEVQREYLALAVDEQLTVAALTDRLQADIAAAQRGRELTHAGKSGRRLPVRFNVTCSLEVPEDIFQEGVHFAAETLRAHMAKHGYEIDIAEVL